MSGGRDRVRIPNTTCQACERDVVMVRSEDGKLLAVEPEIIAVVQFRGARAERSMARRIHAELCDGYQERTRKERFRGDLLAYNKRQRRKGL